MDNTIDTLSLEIKSNANSAVESIDKLAKTLSDLKGSLGTAETGLANFSDAFKRFSESLTGVQLPDNFNSFMDGIKSLSSINADDTGLNKLINALKRLTTADMGNFDLEKFNKIIDSLKSIANIPDVSNSVDRFVSALARLANAGIKTTNVALGLPKLGEALKKVTEEMSGLGGVSDSVNLFVQSLGRLASAGSKAGETAKGLKTLSEETRKFLDTMSRAPNISENTIRMIQALAQLASAGGRASSNLGNLANGLNSVGASANRTKKHVFSLAAAFGKFYATYWLILRGFRLFKKAIDISSDLTEVQNVVDVTFGDMAQKVEDLSKVSIKDFGMSELTAKQISSRFQAMGVAMGFSQEKMSDMSIELTKLAADMASFYNVEQEAVAESLSAIFTGQTRPLRQYGLDLTEATLQEWAMKQGIDANMKSMSQAQKTLLRYNYVLQNSTAAIGDFSRTSGRLCAA